MNVLITGGAGYIGSHISLDLTDRGHKVWIFDNFSTSSRGVIKVLNQISSSPIDVIHGDIRNFEVLKDALSLNRIDAVIHCAGLKSVSESTSEPLEYYDNNVNGSLVLLRAMKKVGTTVLVFSSSATIYGHSSCLPINETHPVQPINPYGKTKLVIEQMIEDYVNSSDALRATSLRYFNPVGSHPCGLIGDNPFGKPQNLMPYILGVLTGKYPFLKVFGGDYDTPDGTAIRDYIHIQDLAAAHAYALNHFEHTDAYRIYNVATGFGSTVLDVLRSMEHQTNRQIPYKIVDRRAGDVQSCYASGKKIQQQLGWTPKKDLNQACADAWNYVNTTASKDDYK